MYKNTPVTQPSLHFIATLARFFLPVDANAEDGGVLFSGSDTGAGFSTDGFSTVGIFSTDGITTFIISSLLCIETNIC